MSKKKHLKQRATSERQVINELRTRVLFAELDEVRERELEAMKAKREPATLTQEVSPKVVGWADGYNLWLP